MACVASWLLPFRVLSYQYARCREDWRDNCETGHGNG